MNIFDVHFEDWFVMGGSVSEFTNWLYDFSNFVSHLVCFFVWEIFFPVRESCVYFFPPEIFQSFFIESVDPEFQAKTSGDLVTIV